MKRAFVVATALSCWLAPTAFAACNHPYFPSAPKTTWEYQSSGLSNTQYTQTILSATPASFVLENNFKTMKVQNTIECAADGSLVQSRYGNMSGTSANIEVETLSHEGAAFPPAAQWVVGNSWKYSYNIKTTTTMGKNVMTQTGTATIQSKILAQETLKVPAGTYTALKVKQTINLDLMMTLGTNKTPIKNTTNTNVWYAKGVGVVKTVTEINGSSSTSVLIRFKKP